MRAARFAAVAALIAGAIAGLSPASAGEKVTISLIRSVSGAPFYIGHDLGFFESEGVTLEWEIQRVGRW